MMRHIKWGVVYISVIMHHKREEIKNQTGMRHMICKQLLAIKQGYFEALKIKKGKEHI